MVDNFSLTFVDLSLAWMLYFHVSLQNKVNFSLAWMLYFHLELQNKEKIPSLEWILSSVWHTSIIPVYPS